MSISQISIADLFVAGDSRIMALDIMLFSFDILCRLHVFQNVFVIICVFPLDDL